MCNTKAGAATNLTQEEKGAVETNPGNRTEIRKNTSRVLLRASDRVVQNYKAAKPTRELSRSDMSFRA
jgi:hypothetical protein